MIQHDRQPNKRRPVPVKDARVGLYIMPETRGRLNLVKAQVNAETGQTLNQDEIIRYLLDTFEHMRKVTVNA